MAQACLTQYFTPKRSKCSSTIFANGEKIKSEKRKILIEDENFHFSSNKKRRISPSKPTDGFLQENDFDQIRSVERKNVCLNKIKDLKLIRKQIDEIKQQTLKTPKKFVPAHERFAHLLVEKPFVNEEKCSISTKKIESPADIRRFVQISENERMKKILSKVDSKIVENLPTTPSKHIVGIKNNLLEQIRLKEESRSHLTSLENIGLIKNEEQRSKTFEFFNQMNESLNIIDQLFTTERQVALEFERIREKLFELHSARFNKDQSNENLNFILKSMEEFSPGYLVSMKLRNKGYIKINRSKITNNQINEFIEKKLIELRE